MSKFYIILLSGSLSIDAEKMRKHFDRYEDWLRFGSEAWIIYTDATAISVRDNFRDEFSVSDPSIIVMPTDIRGWAAYAKDLPRNWLKKDRGTDLPEP